MFRPKDRYDVLVSGMFQLIGYEYLKENGGAALHFSREHNSTIPRDLKELRFDKASENLAVSLIFKDTNIFDLLEPGEYYLINFVRTVRKEDK